MKNSSLFFMIPIFLFFIIALFLFRDFFPAIPFGSDTQLIFYPQRAFMAKEIREGSLPLWNPCEFCGLPTVGTFQASLFYPLTGLFYLLPLPTAFTFC